MPALTERDVETLTVAMVIAPGVYARNRLFDFFTQEGARRARTRAALLRGIVRQLGRASSVLIHREERGGEVVHVLRYAIPALRLSRVVELSSAELAVTRLLAEKANVHTLPSDAGDKALVDRVLARLLESREGESETVFRAARERTLSDRPPE